MSTRQLFDDWPERYDRWFETPLGGAVLACEAELILDLLRPAPGEWILDAGSGTGLFTGVFLDRGARITGLDISLSMLARAAQRHRGRAYGGVTADLTRLPFAAESFDKSVSVTAIEFVTDEKAAVAELFRVTRKGGVIVVATLNSLSPWAVQRKAKARRDPESVFNRVFFRSPVQLLAASPVAGVARTAVHFGPDDDPAAFAAIENQGKGSETGAFVAVRWEKR
jgi:ubiquinone/menaquinone biosynthesis C-methylase UbiE